MLCRVTQIFFAKQGIAGCKKHHTVRFRKNSLLTHRQVPFDKEASVTFYPLTFIIAGEYRVNSKKGKQA